MKTVVGTYRTVAEATKVKLALAGEGIANEHITVIDQAGGDYGTGTGYTGHTRNADADISTVGGKIKHFFSGLAGGDDENTHSPYERNVSGGGALLAVTVPDEKAESVADLLSQHGATEIEGSNAGYSDTSSSTLPVSGGDSNYGTGTGTLDAAATGSTFAGNRGGDYTTNAAVNTTGEQVIPVVEEDLVVGKREVTRGGVRVYSHVTERPVSENITLRDERIVVDRRPVNREATEADFNTNPGVVELTATGEEAVIGKRSRVVEEVLVGKEASERSEQINDTVRRTDVEVEQVPARTATVGTTTERGGVADTTDTKGRY